MMMLLLVDNSSWKPLYSKNLSMIPEKSELLLEILVGGAYMYYSPLHYPQGASKP
jgi:hypothetical protein